MSRKLTQLRGVDTLSSRTQAENARVLDTINAAGEIGGGRLVKDVDVSTTAVEVAHGLGRKWVGCIVTKADTPVSIASSSSSNDGVYVLVEASAAAIVDLWIF